MEFDRELLEILACPSCHGSLRYADGDGELICEACQVAYPVKEGIPDLLPESAKTLDRSEADDA